MVIKGIEFNRPGNMYLECRLQPENPPNEEAVGALKIEGFSLILGANAV